MFTEECDVSLPVLHLMVDSEWICHSLRLEREIHTLSITLWPTWFSLTMRMRFGTLDSSGTAHSIWLRRSVFVHQMLRHYEDNAFIILIGISGCDWHQVYRSYGLGVWSGHWALLFEAVYWLFLWVCELEIAVDDILQRNNCIELNLHWGCRIEHSILHRGLKLRDAISMWQADLEMKHYVSENVCFRVNVLRTHWIYSCSWEARCCSEKLV